VLHSVVSESTKQRKMKRALEPWTRPGPQALWP